MDDILRYKFDKDLLLNYDHDNPPRHGGCCYAEFVEARDYDALREQNRVLRSNLVNCAARLEAYYGEDYPAVRDAKAALTATSQPGGNDGTSLSNDRPARHD